MRTKLTINFRTELNNKHIETIRELIEDNLGVEILSIETGEFGRIK